MLPVQNQKVLDDWQSDKGLDFKADISQHSNLSLLTTSAEVQVFQD